MADITSGWCPPFNCLVKQNLQPVSSRTRIAGRRRLAPGGTVGVYRGLEN